MKSLKCFIWLLCGVGFREEDAELRKLVFEIPWERVETARLSLGFECMDFHNRIRHGIV